MATFMLSTPFCLGMLVIALTLMALTVKVARWPWPGAACFAAQAATAVAQVYFLLWLR